MKEEGRRLRDEHAAWAETILDKVRDAWPDMPTGIEDRDADVWEPLLAIADTVGGEWPKRARAAAVALVTESKRSTPSLGIRLLTDLKKVFGDNEVMATAAILDSLHALDEAPWDDLRESRSTLAGSPPMHGCTRSPRQRSGPVTGTARVTSVKTSGTHGRAICLHLPKSP
jgi:hypothetical protein